MLLPDPNGRVSGALKERLICKMHQKGDGQNFFSGLGKLFARCFSFTSPKMEVSMFGMMQWVVISIDIRAALIWGRNLWAPPRLCRTVLRAFAKSVKGVLSGIEMKKRLRVQVYSLVSSMERHSPNFTQLPPGHRTCSLMSCLNSPGDHMAQLPLLTHGTIQTHKLSLPYQVPTYSWVERVHVWAKCLA